MSVPSTKPNYSYLRYGLNRFLEFSNPKTDDYTYMITKLVEY